MKCNGNLILSGKTGKLLPKRELVFFNQLIFSLDVYKKKICYQMRKYYSCNCMFDELFKVKFSNQKCHKKVLKSVVDNNKKIKSKTIYNNL